MSYLETFLQGAYAGHSIHNREEVEQSRHCGCFSCMARFESNDVWDWVPGQGKQDTASCPYCELDTVLGDRSGLPVGEEAFLRALNKLIFGGPPRFDQAKDPHPISIGREWSGDFGRTIFARQSSQ